MGFSASDVVEVTGLSYRQLDHYVRTGVVRASGGGGNGRGSPRRFEARDVVALVLLGDALRAGARLSTLARAIRLMQRAREIRKIDRLDGLVVWTDGRRAVLLKGGAVVPSASSAGFAYLLDLGAAAARVRARLKEVTHLVA